MLGAFRFDRRTSGARGVLFYRLLRQAVPPIRTSTSCCSKSEQRITAGTKYPGIVEEEVVPVLRVEDVRSAVDWYARLGFAKQWEHQFEPGFPWFVSVARGRVRIFLSEHNGDARPNTLIHLYVNDIEAVSAEFGIPINEDGLAGRECHLEDPDGNRLRIATPRD